MGIAIKVLRLLPYLSGGCRSLHPHLFSRSIKNVCTWGRKPASWFVSTLYVQLLTFLHLAVALASGWRVCASDGNCRSHKKKVLVHGKCLKRMVMASRVTTLNIITVVIIIVV